MRADPRLIVPLAGLLLASAAPLSIPDQRAALSRARAEADAAAQRSRALERQAAGERDAARRAGQREAAVAQRIAGAEADIRAARARVAITAAALADARAELAARQQPATRLVAALQSLARRPGALVLVQPGSTADIVHVRAALGVLAPVVARRSAAVRAEIAHVRKARDDAGVAARSLIQGRADLQAERLALVRMEGEHRLRGRDLDRRALFESDRAIALGEQARDLVDRMEATTADATTGTRLAALDGPLPRPVMASLPADPPQGRFAIPPYRLPAAGRVVAGLGELARSGARARGVTVAATPAAQVVAPAAGRILFARRFRGYGVVVIIDHGRGWSSAVTGLEQASVFPGEQVAQGAPLGRAPQGDPRVTVELRRRGVPVDLGLLLG